MPTILQLDRPEPIILALAPSTIIMEVVAL